MSAAAGEDKTAADQLLPLVYEQLHRAAQRDMASERSGHTLSATSLVHEAYLKLVGPRASRHRRRWRSANDSRTPSSF